MIDSSFDNQVIFKLATIETQVKAISDNLVAAVHRLEDKIADSRRDAATEHTELKSAQQQQEKRLLALENYRDKLAAKVGGVVSVVAVFWALFGKSIEQTLVNIF